MQNLVTIILVAVGCISKSSRHCIFNHTGKDVQTLGF